MPASRSWPGVPLPARPTRRSWPPRRRRQTPAPHPRAARPYNCIAAIIIVGVSQLIEFGMAVYLFKVGGPPGGGGGRVRKRAASRRVSCLVRTPAAGRARRHCPARRSRGQSHQPRTRPRQTHLRDFFVWITAFLCTLFLGAELGLGISIGLVRRAGARQSRHSGPAAGAVAERPSARRRAVRSARQAPWSACPPLPARRC